MWRETWPNLIMKMRDMPYYHYNSKTKQQRREPEPDADAIPGTQEILKKKFSKYIAP